MAEKKAPSRTSRTLMANSDKKYGTPEYFQEQNDRLTISNALATDEDRAGWRAELDEIIPIFNIGNSAEDIQVQGGKFYKDRGQENLNPAETAARKEESLWVSDTNREFDHEYLASYNAENNTDFTKADIEGMRIHAGELQTMIYGEQVPSAMSKYKLPIMLAAMTVATAGMAGVFTGAGSVQGMTSEMVLAGGTGADTLATGAAAGTLTAGDTALINAVTTSLQAAGGSGASSLTGSVMAGTISAVEAVIETVGATGIISPSAVSAINTGVKIAGSVIQNASEKDAAEDAARADIEARGSAIDLETKANTDADAERTAARDLAIAEENLIITGQGEEKVAQLRKIRNTAKRAAIESSNAARDRAITARTEQAGVATESIDTSLAASKETQLPWYEAGRKALDIQQSVALDGDTSKFFTSPSYEFTRDEALGATERTAAARGGLLSGGALEESQKTAAGLASQEFDKWYSRVTGISESGRVTGAKMASEELGAGRDRANIATNLGTGIAADQTTAGQFEADARLRVGDQLAADQVGADQEIIDARKRKAGYFMDTGADIADDTIRTGTRVGEYTVGQGTARAAGEQTIGQSDTKLINQAGEIAGTYFAGATKKPKVPNNAITELE